MKPYYIPVLVVVGLLGVAVLFGSWYVVPEGNVGVKTSFGKVVGDELQPGLGFKVPLVENVRTMSTRSETYTMSASEGEGQRSMSDDAIEALTQEGLNIRMDISVRYHMMPDKGTEVFTNLGTDRQIEQKLIRPTIRSAVRSSTAEFSVNGIYSDKRDELADTIQRRVNDDFDEKGFEVEAVQIRNVMLPGKVRDAIQQKEATQQQIEAKENEIEVEKKEKERKIVEAEAIAESNEIIANSLSEQYLQWYWIQEGLKKGDAMYVPIGSNGLPLFKDVDNTNTGGGN